MVTFTRQSIVPSCNTTSTSNKRTTPANWALLILTTCTEWRSFVNYTYVKWLVFRIYSYIEIYYNSEIEANYISRNQVKDMISTKTYEHT